MLTQLYTETAYALPADSAEPAHRTLRAKHTIIATSESSPAPGIRLVTPNETSHHRTSRVSCTHRYIQTIKSQGVLAQHYAKSAYALPGYSSKSAYALSAYSSKSAYRILGGKRTVIATSKPSRTPRICLVNQVRRFIASGKS